MNLHDALAVCASNSNTHAEVYIPSATVVRVLGERSGHSGVHEGFIVRYGASNYRTLRVEDNVNITGPIPLRSGDTVSLLGQLECDDLVIHWTHHDPRGRHQTGYIKVNGNIYE